MYCKCVGFRVIVHRQQVESAIVSRIFCVIMANARFCVVILFGIESSEMLPGEGVVNNQKRHRGVSTVAIKMFSRFDEVASL